MRPMGREDIQPGQRIAGLTRRWALGSLTTGLSAGFASTFAPGLSWAQSDIADSVNVTRMIQGRYDLTVLSTGRSFGFETFSLFVHGDGTRTLESQIVNNDVNLFRSTIYRVDERFRPLDCHLVLYKDGTLFGSTWVTVKGNVLHATADTMGTRLSHTVDVPDGFSLVPHAGASDGWHFWYLDQTEALNTDITGRVYMMRVRRDSPVGLLGRMMDRPLSYLGEETVPLAGQDFACDVYTFGRPAKLYVTGEDRIPVRLKYEAADRDFHLTEWKVLT